MFDERLISLVDRGADITIKVSKHTTFIQVRFEKETYKATGGTFDKALERVLASLKAQAVNVKAKRRDREHERQDIMEQIEEDRAIAFEVSRGI